jgi:hypothetical protein
MEKLLTSQSTDTSEMKKTQGTAFIQQQTTSCISNKIHFIGMTVVLSKHQAYAVITIPFPVTAYAGLHKCNNSSVVYDST